MDPNFGSWMCLYLADALAWQSCLFHVLLPNQAAGFTRGAGLGSAVELHVTQALHSGAVSSHQATSCWTRATKRCLNKPRNLDSKYSGKQSEQDCMGTHLRPWWVVGWLSLALQMPQPHHPAEALLQTTHAQHKAVSTNYLIYQCVKFSPLS